LLMTGLYDSFGKSKPNDIEIEELQPQVPVKKLGGRRLLRVAEMLSRVVFLQTKAREGWVAPELYQSPFQNPSFTSIPARLSPLAVSPDFTL
jgi:hypothetical protein